MRPRVAVAPGAAAGGAVGAYTLQLYTSTRKAIRYITPFDVQASSGPTLPLLQQAHHPLIVDVARDQRPRPRAAALPRSRLLASHMRPLPGGMPVGGMPADGREGGMPLDKLIFSI